MTLTASYKRQVKYPQLSLCALYQLGQCGIKWQVRLESSQGISHVQWSISLCFLVKNQYILYYTDKCISFIVFTSSFCEILMNWWINAYFYNYLLCIAIKVSRLSALSSDFDITEKPISYLLRNYEQLSTHWYTNLTKESNESNVDWFLTTKGARIN